MDNILLTVARHDLSISVLEVSTNNLDFVLLADGDGADLQKRIHITCGKDVGR